VNELILDLRYNGGGLVDVAQHLERSHRGQTDAGTKYLPRPSTTRTNTSLDKTITIHGHRRRLDLNRLTVIATQ
jgi:C-terminal processing protease CtpA/Prc